MAANPSAVPAVVEQRPSLLAKIAARYSVEPQKMLATLKATAFKPPKVDGRFMDVTNEQMMALLIVADQYRLNPFTKEIFAFPDKTNGIVPVVGVDGWSRIINEHPQFDGIDFVDAPTEGDKPPAWIECVIHRKDREHPTRVREYLAECKRDTPPWRSHPRRMLRHKALIQAARVAFGFAGIYDQDEAERIVERDITPAVNMEAIEAMNRQITGSPAPAPAPAQDDDKPTATYAEVIDRMQKATTVDELDEAASLIDAVADETQRSELSEQYAGLRERLAS